MITRMKIVGISIVLIIIFIVYFIIMKATNKEFSLNQKEVIPIPLGGTNAFIIKGSKNVLVDTGNPGSEDLILEKMTEIGINPKDISLIIITHGHSDHFGSVWELKEKTGAKVAIHKLDADSIRKGVNPPLKSRNLWGTITSIFIKDPEGFHNFEPDILIDGDMDLNNYGVNGKIIPSPGHTAGSISVILESGQLMAGDLLSGSLFQSGKPQLSSYYDDMDQLVSSVKAVTDLSPTIVFTGHGGPFSTSSILKYVKIDYTEKK